MSRPPRRLRATSSCTRVRAALSARHDGEDLPPGLVWDTVTRHLDDCQACQGFASRLSPLSEHVVAVTAATPSPERTAAILTAVAEAEASRRSGPTSRQLRWLVGFAGTVQLILALPVLVGAAGPGLHAGRELGSLQIAIGIGLLLAALQPLRAAGVLPIVAVVTTLTFVIAVVDVAAGVTTVAGELVHVSELVGLAALWALARRTPITSSLPSVRTVTAS